MNKKFLFVSCLILGATLMQIQAEPAGRTGAQSRTVSHQVSAARHFNSHFLNAARASAAASIYGRNGIYTGNSTHVPFGGIGSSGPNFPDQLPFGGNQIPFGRNAYDSFLPPIQNESAPVINEPSGAFAGRRVLTGLNDFGVGNGHFSPPPSEADINNAFARQLNTALEFGGATRIVFPRSHTVVTFVNQNGSIILQGVVADENERRSFVERVKNTRGVNSVESFLHVADRRRPVERTCHLNDALARAGATEILFPETHSPFTLINRNGAVVLQGVVADANEKNLIEERVKNSPDVTAFTSELQVAKN